MQKEMSHVAKTFYRYIRKSPKLTEVTSKQDYLALLASVPAGKTANGQLEILQSCFGHLVARDEYTRLLNKYRIGVKRDEKRMMDNVAARCGLKINWGEYQK